MNNLSKAAIAELIGTFTLVFIGAGSGALAGPQQSAGGLVAVALAHGIAIMVCVYAWGAISGTHINPAVTFGLVITGKIDWMRAVVYWIAQLAGGAAAGFLLLYLFTGVPSLQTPEGKVASLGETKGVLTPDPANPVKAGEYPGDFTKVVVTEGVMTFFLVIAVFGSAVAGRNGNIAGFAIGFVVTMDILCGGYLTGASMNPARTFGPALAMGNLSYITPYFVGPLVGGGAAALLYDRMFLSE